MTQPTPITQTRLRDRLPLVPQLLQKAGLLLGAPTGRLLGFAPTFDPIPGELAPSAA